MTARTPVKTGTRIDTESVGLDEATPSEETVDVCDLSLQAPEVSSNKAELKQDKVGRTLSTFQGNVTRKQNELRKLMVSPSNIEKVKGAVKRCIDHFAKYSGAYEECLAVLPPGEQEEAQLMVSTFLTKQTEQHALLQEAQAWVHDAAIVLSHGQEEKAKLGEGEASGGVGVAQSDAKEKERKRKELDAAKKEKLDKERQLMESKLKEAEVREQQLKEKEQRLKEEQRKDEERAKIRKEEEKKRLQELEAKEKEEMKKAQEAKEREEMKRAQEKKEREERKEAQEKKEREERKEAQEKKKREEMKKAQEKKEHEEKLANQAKEEAEARLRKIEEDKKLKNSQGVNEKQEESDTVGKTGSTVAESASVDGQKKIEDDELRRLKEEKDMVETEKELNRVRAASLEADKRLAELQLREQLLVKKETLRLQYLELEEKQQLSKDMERKLQLETDRWKNLRDETEHRKSEADQWSLGQQLCSQVQSVGDSTSRKKSVNLQSSEKTRKSARGSRAGSGLDGESAAELLRIERVREAARLRELKEGRKDWEKKQDLKLQMKKQRYEEEVKRLEARRKSFERSDSDELLRRQSEPDLNVFRKNVKKKGFQSDYRPNSTGSDSDDVFGAVSTRMAVCPDQERSGYRVSQDRRRRRSSSGSDVSGGEDDTVFCGFRLGGKLLRPNFETGGGGRCCGSSSGLLPLKLPRFSGDPLEYSDFRENFEARVERKVADAGELLAYLKECLDGRALELIKAIHGNSSAKRYKAAWDVLDEHFADPRASAASLLRQISNWKNIAHADGQDLRKFAILLQRCLEEKKTSRHMEALDAHSYVTVVKDKLPDVLQDKWCEQVVLLKQQGKKYPSFRDIVKFVKFHSDILNEPLFGRKPVMSTIEAPVTRPTVPRRPHSVNSFMTGESQSGAASGAVETCSFCAGGHFVDTCSGFLAKTLAERKTFLIVNKLCFACLRPGHLASQCQNRLTCRTCNKRHATSLHYSPRVENVLVQNNVSSEATMNYSVQHEPTRGKETRLDVEPRVYHPVVPVWIKKTGSEAGVKTYAFLDGGSSSCFVAEHLTEELGARGQPTTLRLKTLHGLTTSSSHVFNNLTVCAFDGGPSFQIPRVFSRQSIGISNNCIARKSVVRQWPHLGQVADNMTAYQSDAEIGLLLGTNCTEALEPLEVIPSQGTSLFATRFALGWTVQGPTQPGKPCSEEMVNRAAVREVEELREMIVNFFEQDFIDDRQTPRVNEIDMSPEDRKFMELIHRGLEHDGERFKVPLPFKDERCPLPNNKSQAENRAKGQIRKMRKDEGYKNEYREFVAKMVDRGHAAKVPDSNLKAPEGQVWYLPHHGVRHPTKHKLRVVFDCSARFGPASLNGALLQGPNFINSVFGVLTRFRQHRVAVIGDIQAMFYQVRVPESQRSYLRFLWWEDGPGELQLEEYQMQTHVFGAISSPSVAMFTLRKTGEEFASTQAVREAICVNFYVDDLLLSCPSEKEAVEVTEGLIACCQKGGFKLTKFASNSDHVLGSIPQEDRSESTTDTLLDRGESGVERTLGLYWHVGSDRLRFSLQVKENPFTRRGVLSVISSIYDPLGVLAPAVLPAKRMLQQLCKEKKTGWDDPLPFEYRACWERWLRGVPELNHVSVPRSFDLSGDRSSVQHVAVYCDASLVGQAAVAYMLCKNQREESVWRFVAGKARVAPINSVATVPRMELTAAVTAVTLASSIMADLQYPISVSYFTDSEAVLKYLANERHRQTVFVSNRVRLIRTRSELEQWKHVPTELNPADVGSRGISPGEMYADKTWLYGPKHMPAEEELSAVSFLTSDQTKIDQKSELEKCDNPTARFVSSFSSWFRLRRAAVYMMKFGRWLRERGAKKTADKNGKTRKSKADTLTSAEDLRITESALVAWVQGQLFGKEIADLSKRGFVGASSNLLKLAPVYRDGLLRVGGRLSLSNLDPEVKHPVILPRSHHVTTLIIRFTHAALGHVGRLHTAAALRQRYWIIGGVSPVRHAIHNCVVCKRIAGRYVQQKMADLPPGRVTMLPPFSHVGVDFFGPFVTRMGRKDHKRYGVIFTCLAMRGCHLEVACTLETSSFILALRRFIARRGAVTKLYSDNGTNFVGADKELTKSLKELNQSTIQRELSPRGIEWHFNPPYASHMGGVWERQIRSVRKILASTLRESAGRLTDESLTTFFCEAEAIINSRPLTMLSVDPKDPTPLTASQLLTMKTGPSCEPTGKFVPEDMYAKKFWKHVQLLADTFWSRWQTEFLSNLQPRAKWPSSKLSLTLGDTVLIRDENLPRGRWPLGTVTKTEPDASGDVRTVWLRTSHSGTVKRPVHKLVYLFNAT